jgi:hypothetical protein
MNILGYLKMAFVICCLDILTVTGQQPPMKSTKNEYELVTPENSVISFERVSSQEKRELLKKLAPKALEEEHLDTNGRPAYQLSDGRILHEKTADDFSLIYEDFTQYIRSIRGESFYRINMQFDSSSNLYASFALKPVYASELIQKKHKIDSNFPESEGYRVYAFEDGTLAYLMDRPGDLKQGYWFYNREHFIFFYYKIFQNER